MSEPEPAAAGVDPFVFDWQAEPEGFTKWMLTELIVREPHKKDRFEELAAATEGFTQCKVTVQVNGIPVNAKRLFDGLELNLRSMSTEHGERMAAELLKVDEVRELGDKVQSLMEQAEKAIREKLRSAMTAAGLSPVFSDEW